MIRKAVIPVAGLGTRFLPATKNVPKELLPIVDKPSLMYIVEEAIEAGIEDIVFIAGRNKEAIEDFFDINYELEKKLEESDRLDLLQDLIQIREKANFISIRQQKPLGLGHAILCAKPVIGEDAFAVLLGDELSAGEQKATADLVNTYNDKKQSTVAVMEVPKSEVFKYGIIEAEPLDENTYKILSLVEKPSPEEAPSNLAMPGRYIFTSSILNVLSELKPGRNDEYQLTDAMDILCKQEEMLAKKTRARRYDAGDKLGYLIANVEFALEHPQLKEDFKNYLLSLHSRLT
tara:strand:+ start:8614 stop:9483 length:870 start_codon:yes stop_codon:yes gene_type:complete